MGLQFTTTSMFNFLLTSPKFEQESSGESKSKDIVDIGHGKALDIFLRPFLDLTDILDFKPAHLVLLAAGDGVRVRSL